MRVTLVCILIITVLVIVGLLTGCGRHRGSPALRVHQFENAQAVQRARRNAFNTRQMRVINETIARH